MGSATTTVKASPRTAVIALEGEKDMMSGLKPKRYHGKSRNKGTCTDNTYITFGILLSVLYVTFTQ